MKNGGEGGGEESGSRKGVEEDTKRKKRVKLGERLNRRFPNAKPEDDVSSSSSTTPGGQTTSEDDSCLNSSEEVFCSWEEPEDETDDATPSQPIPANQRAGGNVAVVETDQSGPGTLRSISNPAHSEQCNSFPSTSTEMDDILNSIRETDSRASGGGVIKDSLCPCHSCSRDSDCTFFSYNTNPGSEPQECLLRSANSKSPQTNKKLSWTAPSPLRRSQSVGRGLVGKREIHQESERSPSPLPSPSRSPLLLPPLSHTAIGQSQSCAHLAQEGQKGDSNQSDDKQRRNSKFKKGSFSVEIENRSYLVGPGGSALIGKEELNAALPEEKATIFVGTYNIAGQAPKEDEHLKKWLQPDVDYDIDVYAIGLQEGPALDPNFWKQWEVVIHGYLGQRYLSYYSLRLGVQLLIVYVRRGLIWFLTVPSSSALSTNPANVVKYYVKTKGAVAVAFQLFKTTFLFVSCHLSYGAKSDVRLRDYRKIVDGIKFRKFPLRDNVKSSIENFDRVFWFGDLNFKVEAHRSAVESLLYRALPFGGLKGDFSSILQKDQLIKEMDNGRIFHNFEEGIITFPPTYKYDIGTNKLDSTKNRVPAYTDRILFRDNQMLLEGQPPGVELLVYSSEHLLTISDHKPIFGVFRVKVQPGSSKK